MNYPIWDVPLISGGIVIAIVAIVHVFISHFAVGGGLYLVLTERNDLVASFLGELTTTFNVSTAAITAVQNNEVLNIVDGGSVQITYNDELQATGATDVPVSLVQVVAVTTSPTLPSVMFTASLNGSVDQTIIEPGDSLYIRVVDSNAVALGFTDNVTATITRGELSIQINSTRFFFTPILGRL